MKIEQIEWFPIKSPFSSEEDLRGTNGIMVRASAESGVVGVGEVAIDETCSDLSYVSIVQWLDAYAAALSGTEISNLNLLHQQCDNVSRRAEHGAQAARAAIEMAIYDLIGNIRCCPVHEILGGAYHQTLDMFREIAANAEKPADEALAAIQQGYSGVKLAITDSHPTQNEAIPNVQQVVEKVLAVLFATGTEPYVDVVASQSLGNVARATMMVEQILHDRFHPNFALQQPLHQLDLKGHCQLREKLPVPIILDASITSPEATIQVVRSGAADRIVLDIWRVGGLKNAIRIANICESAAIGITVSGRCCTPVGQAALCHLATSIHGRYAVNIAGSCDSTHTRITDGTVMRNGQIEIGSGSGLGVELNEEWAQMSSTVFQEHRHSIL